jgi:hypothetical protein
MVIRKVWDENRSSFLRDKYFAVAFERQNEFGEVYGDEPSVSAPKTLFQCYADIEAYGSCIADCYFNATLFTPAQALKALERSWDPDDCRLFGFHGPRLIPFVCRVM